MAVGEREYCASHESCLLVLFCKTCEQLICTKCISQSVDGRERHHNHVYLDLLDASDIESENFAKQVARFGEDLQSLKNLRIELRSRIQKLKLELLRRKTRTHRQVQSLRDAVNQSERIYVKQMQQALQPAVVRSEDLYREVDYEIVSREGVVGAAESIQSLSDKQYVAFLQNARTVSGEIADLSKKKHPNINDDLPELACLERIQLSLQHEKLLLKRTMILPRSEPMQPRFLPSWCVIAQTSASLVWKHKTSDKVICFHLYYRPFTERCNMWPFNRENQEFSDTLDGYSHVRIPGLPSKRIHLTLRKLQQQTTYICKLFAVNECGRSKQSTFYLSTSGKTRNDEDCGKICFKKPSWFFSCHEILPGIVYLCVLIFFLCIIYSVYSNMQANLISSLLVIDLSDTADSGGCFDYDKGHSIDCDNDHSGIDGDHYWLHSNTDYHYGISNWINKVVNRFRIF